MSEKTAIIYARVSTSRQANDGLPVESQIEQCHVKAAAIGARVVRVFRDDGISGRVSKRPGLLAALDYCETHRVAAFITWSTSRFARNYLDAGMLKRDLQRMGVQLVYVSNQFGEDDDGWMAEAITTIIDERYSRQIAKDTRRSMAKNAADGFWNGGHAPFGFQAVAVGKRKRLEPNPAEVPVVRMMFRWCIEGGGCKDIAVRLNQSGIGKRGQRWSKARVSSVLKCRAAIGQLTFRGSGSEEIVTQAHAPIVSEEDFMKAQALIKDRAPSNVGGRPRSEAVFAGLLRCECGEAMTTETATGRGGQRYHYYNCRAFLKGFGCRSHRLPVADLDHWLLDGILDKVFTPDNLRSVLLDLKQSVSQWVKDHEELLATLTAEQQDVDRRLRRLYDSIEAGAGLELADVAPRLRELQARKKALAEEIDKAESEVAPEVTLSDAEISRAQDEFRAMVTEASQAKIRSFLGVIVRQAVVSGEDIRVEYFPDRIMKAVNGGSYCEVRWLPDLTTLRTTILILPDRLTRRKAA